MVVLAGPTVLAFFSGGFFDRPRLTAALVALVLVVLVAVLGRPPLPSGRAGRAALAGLALLFAVTALSTLWAPVAAAAFDDAQRVLLYLAATVAAAAILRPRATARMVEPAIAFGGLVVVGYALSERLLPQVIDLLATASAAGRLEQPLTYWNALGAVAALALTASARIVGTGSAHVPPALWPPRPPLRWARACGSPSRAARWARRWWASACWCCCRPTARACAGWG